MLTSTALTIPARQTRRTTVHHNHRFCAALAAHGGVGWEVAGLIIVGGGGAAGFELGTLLGEDAFGGFAHLLKFHQANRLQVLLDNGTDVSNQRGHEHPAFFEVAAVRVVYGAQLFYQERKVATFAEYR